MAHMFINTHILKAFISFKMSVNLILFLIRFVFLFLVDPKKIVFLFISETGCKYICIGQKMSTRIYSYLYHLQILPQIYLYSYLGLKILLVTH